MNVRAPQTQLLRSNRAEREGHNKGTPNLSLSLSLSLPLPLPLPPFFSVNEHTLYRLHSASTRGEEPSNTWHCSSRSPLSRPLPSSDLVRCGAVTRQGHCDAQAFVAKELPETSLPPSSGCAVDANNEKKEEIWLHTQNPHGFQLFTVVVVTFFRRNPRRIP